MSLPLLGVDDTIIVVDKPTLLLSVPGRGEAKQDSVITRLAREYAWVREVHRLDWETSGVLLTARTAEAHRELSRQFSEREVAKRYIAVVAGRLEMEEGTVELPLIADWPNRPRQMVDPERGKPALTHWRLLETGDNWCRVELLPVTGRSHQLRVHMQAIGHPILGDRLYADREAQQGADRLLLHAASLSFTHPVTGQRLTYESNAPF